MTTRKFLNVLMAGRMALTMAGMPAEATNDPFTVICHSTVGGGPNLQIDVYVREGWYNSGC